MGDVHDGAPQGSRYGAGSCHGGLSWGKPAALKDECIAHQGDSETIDE